MFSYSPDPTGPHAGPFDPDAPAVPEALQALTGTGRGSVIIVAVASAPADRDWSHRACIRVAELLALEPGGALLVDTEPGTHGLGERLGVSGTEGLSEVLEEPAALDRIADFARGHAFLFVGAGVASGDRTPVLENSSWAPVLERVTSTGSAAVLHVQLAAAGAESMVARADAVVLLGRPTDMLAVLVDHYPGPVVWLGPPAGGSDEATVPGLPDARRVTSAQGRAAATELESRDAALDGETVAEEAGEVPPRVREAAEREPPEADHQGTGHDRVAYEDGTRSTSSLSDPDDGLDPEAARVIEDFFGGLGPDPGPAVPSVEPAAIEGRVEGAGDTGELDDAKDTDDGAAAAAHDPERLEVAGHVENVEELDAIEAIGHVEELESIEAIEAIGHVEEVDAVEAVGQVEEVEHVEPVEDAGPVADAAEVDDVALGGKDEGVTSDGVTDAEDAPEAEAAEAPPPPLRGRFARWMGRLGGGGAAPPAVETPDDSHEAATPDPVVAEAPRDPAAPPEDIVADESRDVAVDDAMDVAAVPGEGIVESDEDLASVPMDPQAPEEAPTDEFVDVPGEEIEDVPVDAVEGVTLEPAYSAGLDPVDAIREDPVVDGEADLDVDLQTDVDAAVEVDPVVDFQTDMDAAVDADPDVNFQTDMDAAVDADLARVAEGELEPALDGAVDDPPFEPGLEAVAEMGLEPEFPLVVDPPEEGLESDEDSEPESVATAPPRARTALEAEFEGLPTVREPAPAPKRRIGPAVLAGTGVIAAAAALVIFLGRDPAPVQDVPGGNVAFSAGESESESESEDEDEGVGAERDPWAGDPLQAFQARAEVEGAQVPDAPDDAGSGTPDGPEAGPRELAVTTSSAAASSLPDAGAPTAGLAAATPPEPALTDSERTSTPVGGEVAAGDESTAEPESAPGPEASTPDPAPSTPEPEASAPASPAPEPDAAGSTSLDGPARQAASQSDPVSSEPPVGRPEPAVSTPPPVAAPNLTPPPPNSGVEPGTMAFGVEVARHGSLGAARSQALDLGAANPGVMFNVVPVDEGGVVYRVVAGPATTRAGAERIRAGLGAAAGAGQVRATQWTYLLGVFGDYAEAITHVTDVQSDGLPAYLVEIPVGEDRVVYRAYSGAFGTEAEAATLGALLEGAGYAPTRLVERVGRPMR